MSILEIEKSCSVCGLVCALCSYSAGCVGCQCKEDDCEVKACCRAKGLAYCYQCGEWPCDKKMHQAIRIKAFNLVARSEGLHILAEYLYKNLHRGICYHRPDGLTGDYDRCKTEQEVIELLRHGKPDPFEKCPEYESKNFRLRLVSTDDAADLLECYQNPTISVQGNAENCTYGYGSHTLAEMQDFIRRWLEEYKNRCFIRFSILDKQKSQVIGTVEIFRSDHGEYSIMRVDVKSQYENEEVLSELLKICDNFFFDIPCDRIVTRGMPGAFCRINALKQNGFVPCFENDKWGLIHCYIKVNPQNGT